MTDFRQLARVSGFGVIVAIGIKVTLSSACNMLHRAVRENSSVFNHSGADSKEMPLARRMCHGAYARTTVVASKLPRPHIII